MVNFGIFVNLESAELHRCLTGSGFVGNKRESSDVLLPEHLSQASAREILLWVDNETEQRYLKWIGCCERCELNGDAVALNREYPINAGDDLVVTAKTGSVTLRYCPNEQSAAICVAAAQRSKRRPAKEVTKPPPPAPPLPTREALAAKYAQRIHGDKPAAPPPAPPLPPRGTFTARLTENRSVQRPAAAPPPPPMPSRAVLTAKLANKQTAKARSGPPPPPAPPPPPPAGHLRAQQPPVKASAPDPGHFLQQLAMAVCQQKARLQQVPVNVEPVPMQPAPSHSAGPPSEQMLQTALASLRRVPAEIAPPEDAAEVTPSDNFLVAADSRPSDPFAHKMSISSTRSSFEPTMYLGDLGAARKSSMYNRDSQSMRPSCAPVPECEELEAFARDVPGNSSMSPAYAPQITATTPASVQHSARESLSLRPSIRRSNVGPEMESAPAVQPDTERCVNNVASITPAVSGVSVNEHQHAHLSQRSTPLSVGGDTPVGADPTRPAATTGTIASGWYSTAASVARSISLAPAAVSPQVAAQSNLWGGSHVSKAGATPGSISVGLDTLQSTPPPSAAQSAHNLRQPMSHAASVYAGTPASVSTGQVTMSQQHSHTQKVDVAEFLRQQYILSRVQTLLPEGGVDLLEDVEGFLAQVKKCMIGNPTSGEPGAQSPGPSIAASALTVQQELKRGLGKGKDLMRVCGSAPQATTVSQLSAPVRLHTPNRSRGSWIVQGPDFAVPSRDAEALVGRRLWLNCRSIGWAPGTVTEYLAPNGNDAGIHVVTFNADTAVEYEEHMDIMEPTEKISWRDPNQKVRCRSVESSQYPAITLSQPPASEITVGAMMDATATPSVLGPRTANMQPSTAGSLAPDYPMLDSSNSSPLLPLAGPVWATPGALPDSHILKPSNQAGAGIPLPSPQTQTKPPGTDKAATPAPQSTPIRSNTGMADEGVPSTWWEAINSGNVSRCTDMLANMLRSPAAAQLPESLRLPLESAIASACASPSLSLSVNPKRASETEVFWGRLSAPLHEEPSAMEGVEVTASPMNMNAGARSWSDFEALELNAYLGTEFLQLEPFSQEAGGADGNFTQPLSPSIFHTAQLGKNATGTSGVQNAAGGFDWLVSETDAAMQLSPPGGTPVTSVLNLPASAAAKENAGAPATFEKQDSMKVHGAAASSIPSIATGGTLTTCLDACMSQSVRALEALTANDAPVPATTSIPQAAAAQRSVDAQKQQPESAAGSGEGSVQHEPEGGSGPQQDMSTAALHAPTRSSTATASSIRAHGAAIANEQNACARPASPLSACGIPTPNPIAQQALSTGAVLHDTAQGAESPEESISVGMATQPAEHTSAPSPGVHQLQQDQTSEADKAACIASADASQHAPTLSVPNSGMLPIPEHSSPRASAAAAPERATSPVAPVDTLPASPSFRPRSCSPPASPAIAPGEAVDAVMRTVTDGAGTPKWRASLKAGVPKSPLSSAGMISEALSPRGSLDAPVHPVTTDGAQTPVAFAGTPVAFAAAAESVAGKSTLMVAAQFTRGMQVVSNAGIPAEAPHSSVSAAGSSHSPIGAPLFAGNSSMLPTAGDGASSPTGADSAPAVVNILQEAHKDPPEDPAAPVTSKTAFGSPTAITEAVAASHDDAVLEDVAKAVAEDMPACTPEEHPLPAEFLERRVTPVVCAWRSTDRLHSPSPSPSKAAAASPQFRRTPLITRTLVGDMPPNTGLRGAATPNVTPMSSHPSAFTKEKLPVNLADAVNAILRADNNMTDAVPSDAAGSPLVAVAQHHSSPVSQAPPALIGLTPKKSAPDVDAVTAVAMSLPEPSAEDCVRVMHELAEQTDARAELSAEQVAAIRTTAKRPSMLLAEAPPKDEATQPAASASPGVAAPECADDAAANVDIATVEGANEDAENAAAAEDADAENAAIAEGGNSDDVTVPGKTDDAADASAEATEQHPHDQENADPPVMLRATATLSESSAKPAAISTADAQNATSAAEAAIEADGPARRTRRRASIAIVPASMPLDEPALAPSRRGADIKNINVQDAKAALAAAKAASSQEGSALRTRKRLSMSVSADVESVRKSQAACLLKCTEEQEKEEQDSHEDEDGSPHDENIAESADDKDSGPAVSASMAPPDEEDAAPKGPLTRRRRASVAVHQPHDHLDSNAAVEAPTERRNTRRRRDESAALETDTPQEVADAPGPCLRTRARCGATPAEPTGSDTTKTRQGAAKRTRATRAAAADSAATDGNVSDSEGPMTRRRRAKVGTAAADSEEAGGASAGTWGGKARRGQRRNKTGAADVESESLMTDVSESMADGEENKGSAAANSATSKLALSEADGIRIESFRPKLSAVPEDEEATIKRGRPGRRKKPYQPIPDMPKMLSTIPPAVANPAVWTQQAYCNNSPGPQLQNALSVRMRGLQQQYP